MKEVVLVLLALVCFSLACETPSAQGGEYNSVGTGVREAVCFVYHRFGDNRYPSTNVSTENFAQHLKFLKDNSYEVLTLADAVDYLRNGTANRKVAVITVDDGYKSFLTGAMPLLKQYGYPATLFINTETVGSGSYLDWNELKQIVRHGVEIGNHSHSHDYFLNNDKDKQLTLFKEDVKKAQRIIKEQLDVEAATFAYPYGEYTPEMALAVKEMGFKAAVAQNSGVMQTNTDLYTLPRYPMAHNYADINGFKEKARMSALRVKSESPSSVLLSENPPKLEVEFSNNDIDAARLQCFVQGGSCDLEILSKQPLKVKITAKAPLKRRRTLYTLTIPSKNGGWRWYSHLWVRPEVKE